MFKYNIWILKMTKIVLVLDIDFTRKLEQYNHDSHVSLLCQR